MNVKVHGAFFAICFLTDTLLGILFPVDTSFLTLVFIPQMTLAGLILSVNDMNLTNHLLLAMGLGLWIDFTRYGFEFVTTFAFLLTVLVVHIWSKHMSESIYERVILVVIGIFVNEWILYFFLTLTGTIRLDMVEWLSRREFLTILGNVPLIVACIYLNDFKEDQLSKQDRVKRAKEKVHWMNVNS